MTVPVVPVAMTAGAAGPCAASSGQECRHIGSGSSAIDHGAYVDGAKQQVDAIASNMGHCLWTGIVDDDKAAAVAAATNVGVEDGYGLEAASIAKAFVGDCGIELAQNCLQVFGGIGYTWEHDQHLFLQFLERFAGSRRRWPSARSCRRRSRRPRRRPP